MRRQDRTAGKKKKEKAANRLALMGITLVVLSLAVTVHLSGISMEEKDLQYRLKEEQLEKQKSEEEQRAQELEEYRIYVQTKEYIEKVAKEKLGLVNQGRNSPETGKVEGNSVGKFFRNRP